MKTKQNLQVAPISSLRSAIALLSELDIDAKPTSQIVESLNIVVNSQDIAHMNRKGLLNGLRYVVQNIDSLSVISEDGNEKAENTVY